MKISRKKVTDMRPNRRRKVIMSVIYMLLILFFGMHIAESVRSAQDCGMKKSLSRIVGGRDSGGYHYPWFALLVLKENTDFPVCAGSLITPRHVLSAAHCFTIKPSTPKESLFNVIMGVYDRCNHSESTRQMFVVSHVVIHEDYLRGEKFHDIALMTLEKFAHFTIVCLPSPGTSDETEPALLIGFGVTKEGDRKAPCHMMEAKITKYSKRDCRNSDLPKIDIEEPTVICAGNIQGGTDSCQGDSGGPLHTLTPNGRYVIAGIVSYGYGCANPGLPGIYTDVASYLNWISIKISASQSVDGNKSVRHFNRHDVKRNKPNSPENRVTFPEVHSHSEDKELPLEPGLKTLEPRNSVKKQRNRFPLGYTERSVVFPSDRNFDKMTAKEYSSYYESAGGSQTVNFPNNRK